MARKRTHTDAARTRMVGVRLREDTYERVLSAATAAGMNRASYIEHLIENRAVKVEQVASSALPVPFINELKRIGNNLNQIAHNAHCELKPEDGAILATVEAILKHLVENELVARRLQSAVDAGPPSALSPLAKDVWSRLRPEIKRDDQETAQTTAQPAANGKTVITLPKGWCLVPEVNEPFMTSRPWIAPTGFNYTVTAVDGEIVATPTDHPLVRIARTIWFKFSPPPEPQFDEVWRCNGRGDVECVRRPRRTASANGRRR